MNPSDSHHQHPNTAEGRAILDALPAIAWCKLPDEPAQQRREVHGYADIAAELDNRDGWPLEEDFLTDGMPPDDYIHCNITQKQDSDIGPFDIVDMRDPLPEAFELVEDGHITESDFHDFVFGNAVRLWGTQNPRYFEGTAVAKEVAALLKRGAPTLRAPPK
jgi:hypothetical protein